MLRSRLFWTMLIPLFVVILAVGWLSPILMRHSLAWLIIVSGLLVAVGLAWWMYRHVAAPLESMAGTAIQFRNGRPFERFAEFPFGEIGTLAGALNDMGEHLAERVAELERRDAQHAQAEQLLQAVLRTMSEGVVVVDSRQRILFTNEAARPLFTSGARELLGRHLWEVARSPHVQELVQPVLEAGGQRQTEFELPRTRSVIAATATALPHHPVPGAVLMVQNVTELRRLEKLRHDFVSNVSHELKTPLTTIQACADTLLEGAIDDPQRNREFLEGIIEQSERLYELILDLLRLAKIESQQEAFDIREVDLAGPVTTCLDSHAAVADGKGIELRGEGSEESIFVLADARELRTILDNLLDNALNYTPAGGRVTVRWSRDGELARLEVQDTGVGISKDQQTRIFERFYRADRARDRSRGGTGLGLAIVKHLAQLFGGSVEVSSEIGRGSTFTVTLPTVEHPAVEASPMTGVSQSSSETGTAPAMTVNPPAASEQPQR